MEALLSLDHALFIAINHLPHTVGTDTLALGLSGIGMGGFIWLVLSILVFIRVERREHWFFLPVVMAAALSELLTNEWLKYLFARNRPPLSLGTVIIGASPGDYSFPSGHATFSWALAAVLAAKEPRLKWFYYALATVICFSRIYLGVHYPSDIAAGTLVGIAIGLGSLWAEKQIIYYRIRKRK